MGAPDGSRLYVTNEARSTLDMVDAETLAVMKRIPLTGHPNNVAVSKDGRRVYAGIAEAPGAVDVIDTVSLTNAKSIPVKGAIHNVYVTPDGRYVVSGSIPGRMITVIDQQSELVAWNCRCPPAFARSPSSKRATARCRGCSSNYPTTTVWR